jgi:hypothetical protein
LDWSGFVKDDGTLILGDETSMTLTLTPHEGIWNPAVKSTQYGHGFLSSGHVAVQNPSDELVGCLPFLYWLHRITRASLESEALPKPLLSASKTPDSLLEWRHVPALVMRERSWDFQPPDTSAGR